MLWRDETAPSDGAARQIEAQSSILLEVSKSDESGTCGWQQYMDGDAVVYGGGYSVTCCRRDVAIVECCSYAYDYDRSRVVLYDAQQQIYKKAYL